MSDFDPTREVLDFLRVQFARMDARFDGLERQMAELRLRVTTLEQQVAQLVSMEASHYVSLSSRLDRLEVRIERIERRLDLTEAH